MLIYFFLQIDFYAFFNEWRHKKTVKPFKSLFISARKLYFFYSVYIFKKSLFCCSIAIIHLVAVCLMFHKIKIQNYRANVLNHFQYFLDSLIVQKSGREVNIFLFWVDSKSTNENSWSENWSAITLQIRV